MKSVMIIMAAFFSMCGMANGAYTYMFGLGTDFGGLDLSNSESILVNGGVGDSLGLFNYSSAMIESTGGHGIRQIDAASHSSLTITGGEIGSLHMSSYSQATLSGGVLASLYCQLIPPVPTVPADRHIQIICKSWEYDSNAKHLTGVWADNSTFSIWADSFWAYDNMNFTIVPEPMTLAILALGGIFVRSRRSRL